MAEESVQPAAEEQILAAPSVHYLLSLDDATFVKSAFRTLFKRPVDEASEQYYLARLQQGVSRQTVLTELRRSPEGKACNVDIHGLEQITQEPAASVAELLVQADASFVRYAFLTLLKRDPDEVGGPYYTKRVRDGGSKAEIVAELAASDEAREKAVNLPGLEEICARFRRYRLPIVGSILRRLSDADSTAPLPRKLRALENKLTALDEIGRVQHHLETTLANADARLSVIENRIADMDEKLRQGLSAPAQIAAPTAETRELDADAFWAQRESRARLSARGNKIHLQLAHAVEVRKSTRGADDANRD